MVDRAARVLIVADDLTGALDTAGPFAARGVRTKVVAEPLACDPAAVEQAQVVALNTASRHLPAEQAASHVRQCVARFAGQAFGLYFKKIDSTLRGNVVAETLAVMSACKLEHALIAPAFPAQGRTVIDGVVHVDGVPLAQTGFARDALSPPPLQPLGEVFGDAIGRARVGAWRSNEKLAWAGHSVVVADALRDADLSEVFDQLGTAGAPSLLVGSAGLGNVLAHHLQGGDKPPLPVTTKPIVFVVGSRASRSREQVERLRALPDTRAVEAPNGRVGDAADVQGANQIVLLAVEDARTGAGDAVEVAANITRAGLEMIDRVGADVCVVTGGDTAIALLTMAKCRVIDVCGDVMPGIPFASFQWQGRTIHLITKAGGFGVADTMIEIVRRIRAGEGEPA